MTGGKIPVIMAGWTWIRFEGAISHMVANELIDVIVADLEDRGCPLAGSREGTELFLDQPGMVAMSRPTEHIDLRGLMLEIPSEDVGPLRDDLLALKLRGGCYYKLHGFHRCIVLTPALRDELLHVMGELYPMAEARAHEFYATRPLPSEVLRDIAAKQMGVERAEVPNLGANSQDRFRSKGSGSLPN